MSTKNLNYSLLLFRFWISSHNLRIETGRYIRSKTPENERLCLYCTTQAVENDSYFTLSCNLYSHERVELFNIVCKYVLNSIQLTNEEKFVTATVKSDKTNNWCPWQISVQMSKKEKWVSNNAHWSEHIVKLELVKVIIA